MDLSLLIGWKRKNNELIIVNVNCVTKMIYHKPLITIINTAGLAKIIFNVVVRHYGLLDSIVRNKNSLLTLKLRSFLCYFLGIKQKLSTSFYLQIDGQTKRQNSNVKAYIQVFVNWE